MASTVDAKIRALVATLRDEPRNMDARLRLAKLYAKASRTELAITEYLHLSNVYAAQNDFRTSLDFLKRVLELQGTHAFANRSVILRSAQSGRTAGAVAHLERFIGVHVRPLATNGETGEALARLRSLGDLLLCGPLVAAMHLREIVALDPYDVDSARALATLLVADEPKEAITLAHRCLRVNPDDLDALAALAGSFARLGDREKARAAWEQTIAAAERAGNEPSRDRAQRMLRELA